MGNSRIFQTINLNGTKLAPALFLAPMAGITNSAFRRLDKGTDDKAPVREIAQALPRQSRPPLEVRAGALLFTMSEAPSASEQILHLHKELPLRCRESVCGSVIQVVVRQSGIERREGVQLVAEEGIHVEGPVERIELCDRPKEHFRCELVDADETSHIAFVERSPR